MLVLNNVGKDYLVGGKKLSALKNVNLSFRDHEFVAILGPSGCGKTTLLNLLGGLDQATSGEIFFEGKSTKNFTEKNWNSYRNHNIGFVFQSYNLIQHETVLGNVSLAQTLSGVKKEERVISSKKTLSEVGLLEVEKKFPSQLSGGQCQRVAIARSLVNKPKIVLADEPTGALDSENSVAVMKLLQEVSKTRLVILVTHNAELAKSFATRIIYLKDGEVQNDSNPYQIDNQQEIKEEPKNKKIKMSFFTGLSLSFRNLLTKKARTIIVSLAGSMGIIGLALLLSLSMGFKKYIAKVEQDTLTNYPLVLTTSSTSSISNMLKALQETSNSKKFPSTDYLSSRNLVYSMMDSLLKNTHENDLSGFKEYLTQHEEQITPYVTDINYAYSMNLNLYTSDYKENGVHQILPYTIQDKASLLEDVEEDKKTLISTLLDNFQSLMRNNRSILDTSTWSEMINNTDFLSSQYDVLKGTWPKAKDEIVLVTDEYNEIPDYFLYALGLKNEKELVQAMLKDDSMQSTTYTFDELLSRTFKLVLDSSYYTKNSNGYYSKKTLNSDGFESILDQSLTLKIVGIVRPKDVDNSSISSTIGYTSMLKEYILQQNRASEVALAQEEKIVRDENGQFVSGTSVISGAQLTKSGYESIFNAFGIRDESTPYSITIYPNSFDAKDKVIEFIDEYNEEAAKKARNDLILQYAEKNQTASKEELASVEKAAKINYSDSVKTVINRMNKIFKSIRYVLVIFVVISLIVSGIMIGIITYISVLERTKEIGILRSLGASRMDVSTIFNAETLLLGLFSGIIGVVLGFLFTVPMNLLIEYFAGIKLQASLPLWGALALVVISMILTLLGGIIPSVYASTKDPVVALRSE